MATALLLHGIPGSPLDWQGVAADLDGDLDAICPPLVGFEEGGAGHEAGELWADAQARAIARRLPSQGDVIVVGHDFGGPVALHLVPLLGDRVRGLVLAACNVFTDTPVPFPLNLVHLPGLPRLLFSRPSLRMMLRGHPDPASAIGPAAQHAAIRTIFTTALRDLRARYAEVERLLGEVRVPTEVVWGERDPFFGLEQGRRTAETAGAPLRVVEGAGHFLPREAPGALADAIRALGDVARRSDAA